MKKCNDCNQQKPFSEFNTRTVQGKTYYRTCCKNCQGVRDRNYYATNRDKIGQRQKASDAVYMASARAFVYGYLKQNSCVDCGESDIVVLEFDHVRGEKVSNVSTMVARHSSLELIKAEINKCEVRCANCHRRVTALRGNWSVLDY